MASTMTLGDTFLIGGIKIIENSNMVVNGEPYEVRHTWHERLFTRPWKPFKTMRTVIPKIPKPEVLQFEDKWIMHPEIATKLKKEIK